MPAISLFLVLYFAQGGAPRGMVEFNRGEYQRARIDLEMAPQDAQSRAFLALTRAAMGECEAVTPDLERQFAVRTDAALRRLSGLALAQCDIGAKRFDAAEPVIAALEKDYPSDADVLYVSASLHMKAWNDAVYRMYEKAPASYRVNQLSAEVFETQSKYAEAAAEYRKAIQKNPGAINLHYRLGRAILLQSHEAGNLEQARREFEAELSLNPSDAVAEYQIGQILVAQGKADEGAARFQRAMALRPDFPEAVVEVAKIRSSLKQYDEAVKLLERAVALQPRSEVARYNLMLAYRNAGRGSDAQREKAELDKLQRPPEGEFTDFLKRLGEEAPKK